jgi:hypothetical protein
MTILWRPFTRRPLSCPSLGRTTSPANRRSHSRCTGPRMICPSGFSSVLLTAVKTYSSDWQPRSRLHDLGRDASRRYTHRDSRSSGISLLSPVPQSYEHGNRGLRRNRQCHRVLLFLAFYQDFRALRVRDQDQRSEALKNTFWRNLEMLSTFGCFAGCENSVDLRGDWRLLSTFGLIGGLRESCRPSGRSETTSFSHTCLESLV